VKRFIKRVFPKTNITPMRIRSICLSYASMGQSNLSQAIGGNFLDLICTNANTSVKMVELFYDKIRARSQLNQATNLYMDVFARSSTSTLTYLEMSRRVQDVASSTIPRIETLEEIEAQIQASKGDQNSVFYYTPSRESENDFSFRKNECTLHYILISSNCCCGLCS
jgi:hypothetical protein